MKKVVWIFVNIIAFGIPYIYARNKAKKSLTISNTELQVSNKVDIDVEELINTLGGKRNIVDTSTTISTLKINVRDNSTLTKEKFDKFKITGFLKNTNQVILVFGDNAQAINEKLIKKL